MMKHEFEALAGYEVSNEDYNNIIEPMYMAVNMTKAEFVKVIDKKRFALPTKAQMIKEMRKIADHLFEICGHRNDYPAEEELDRIAKAYAKRFHGIDWANNMNAWVFCEREYEFPQIQRGCTYPKVLTIGVGNNEYERITLVK